MQSKAFFPRMAWNNLVRNRQFFLPYLLSMAGCAAAFYILCALGDSHDLPQQIRYSYLQSFVMIGIFVVALFVLIFMSYTASFLTKRRRRELGLYNVLGMGKGHIARMLCWESLYSYLLGVAEVWCWACCCKSL